MIYIRSTLVGLITLLAATVVYLVATIAVFMRSYQPPPGGMVRISLPELLSRPMYWFIALAAFALGFYWEFRRAM